MGDNDSVEHNQDYWGSSGIVRGRGRRRRRLWVLACGGVVLASHSIVHYYNQLLF